MAAERSLYLRRSLVQVGIGEVNLFYVLLKTQKINPLLFIESIWDYTYWDYTGILRFNVIGMIVVVIILKHVLFSLRIKSLLIVSARTNCQAVYRYLLLSICFSYCISSVCLLFQNPIVFLSVFTKIIFSSNYLSVFVYTIIFASPTVHLSVCQSICPANRFNYLILSLLFAILLILFGLLARLVAAERGLDFRRCVTQV